MPEHNTPWTPGPWRETIETRSVEICTIHCCSPRSTNEPKAQGWVYIVSDNSITRSEVEQDANARLIAAAPALYEALARLLECQEQSLRGGCMPADFWLAREGARAALALARGETNG